MYEISGNFQIKYKQVTKATVERAQQLDTLRRISENLLNLITPGLIPSCNF